MRGHTEFSAVVQQLGLAKSGISSGRTLLSAAH
jgi:hypothetical protein